MSPSVDGRGTRHKQLPEEVAGYVREQIMSGNLKPGDFLRMEPIAEAVGVSMTPVREGLLALSSEGFVNAIPRRGFVVADFSRQDVRDLFWAQSRLSGELAARAARRISQEELANLTTVMGRYDKAIDLSDTDEVSRLGHEFHRIINLSAKSPRLAQILSSVVKHLPNHFYASMEAHAKATVPQHRAIFDAVRTGDTERARRATEEHIGASADYIIDLLEDRGLWESDYDANEE